MVDEFFFEIMCSITPILLQIHRQVAGHNHAPSVWHEASLIHLSHQGVYKGHSCLPISPSLEGVLVSLPVVVSSVVNAIGAKALVAIPHKPVAVEVAPKQLVDEDSGGLVGAMLFDVVSGIVEDLPGGEGAVCEPRRKLAGVLGADEIVSGESVVTDGALLEDVFSQTLETFGLATDERVTSTFVRLLSN